MFMLPPRSHRAFIAAAACFQQNQIMANGSAPPTEILRRCVRRRAVPCHHCAADSRPAGCNFHKVCQVFSVQVAFALQRFPLYKQEVLQTGSGIFESSACVEHVDVLVSHRWGSGRWAKYLALCLYSNLTAAVVCSLTTWILATVCMIAYARGVANLGGNHLLLPILVLFPIGVFLVVFFLGHHAVHSLRPMSVWMDKACIHQTDHDFKHRQIQALPVFVALGYCHQTS